MIANFHNNLRHNIRNTPGPVLLFFAVWLLFSSIATPLFASPGFIPVRNFKRDLYGGGPQNWGAVQDSIGRMYFGNRDGMLCFDGSKWHIRYIPYGTAVRSLFFDAAADRIYVGGSQEFGYFLPDSISGELIYHSLLPNFAARPPQFSEVWNIFKLENKIWFQADMFLFCLSEGRVNTFPAEYRISKSAVIDGRIFLGLDNGKLIMLNGSKFETFPGSEILLGKKISAILPMDGGAGILVATSTDGLFLWKNGGFTPLDCDISDFLKENFTFCGAARGDNFVFGTINNGAVIKNFKSGSTRFINKETGMQNNTVLHADFDREGNVWLSLDNGIDYADISAPILNLIGSSNEIGAGYASLLYGDRILLGTNRGLYSAPYPFEVTPSPTEIKQEMIGQVWSITRVGEDVFISADTGVFIYNNGGIKKIPGIGGSHMVLAIPGQTHYALASTYNCYYLLTKTDVGWVNSGLANGFNDIGGRFAFDSKGNIWQSHWRKGIYRLRYNPENNSFYNVNLISTEQGLPSKDNNTVNIIDGEAIISTADGFYSYDETTGNVTRRPEFETLFGSRGPGHIESLSDSMILHEYDSRLRVARKNSKGKYTASANSIHLYSDMVIHGFVNINYINPGEIIVSNQEGFWNINLNKGKNETQNLKPFINTIYANRDSLVYRALPDGAALERLTLPHSLNSLRVDFALPEYARSNEVKFSSYLEPYEKEWSPFSDESSREFTRLDEGNYILHLKAMAPDGDIEEIAFSFRIRPPWYRSIWAYSGYFIIIVLSIAFGIKKLREWNEKSRLKLAMQKEKELDELRKSAEQEALRKDYEIATLKSEQLETDIISKSKELSHTTMNLIRKNEILNDLEAGIAKLQEGIGDEDDPAKLKRQLGKIRASIRENISHDTDLKDFMRNFDFVYGDYTKRLSEKHPLLSASDIRICCYIRMGLTSKDIAPLVNISYRSVEMARYRIRRKMNLKADQSLTEYLTNL